MVPAASDGDMESSFPSCVKSQMSFMNGLKNIELARTGVNPFANIPNSQVLMIMIASSTIATTAGDRRIGETYSRHLDEVCDR